MLQPTYEKSGAFQEREKYTHAPQDRSIFSRRSYRSILSYASTGSILSVGSAGSILSVGSAGSILSIGSAGSILSVFSAGSILSLLSAGSILCILRYRAVRNEQREKWPTWSEAGHVSPRRAVPVL